ncbi:MAG: hypothetical protein Salg2KO_04570 [Salibacteraceae bacterium]
MDKALSKFLQATDLIASKLGEWTEQFILLIPNIILSVLVLIAFGFLARIVKRISKKGLSKLVDSSALVTLTATILQFTVVSIGFIIALNLLSLEKTVTSILAGAGVIGLALGFAFQESAANFISGVFIAIRKPLKIGDIVIINHGEMGEVDRINLRSTVVKTFQGQDLIIPNKDVFQNEIKNYSTGSRRVDLECGISYGDDLNKVKKITTEAIESLGIHQDGTDIEFYFTAYGDSSINFSVRAWIDYPSHPDFLQARSDMIIALKRAFDENDITIPFPIRTLDFGAKGGKSLSEETKGLSIA